MAYRFAVIDTSTEIWDPPPSRPSVAPAWIGASLSSAMILALLAAGGVFAHAWNDERYRETGDTCSRLDITAVATRLGDPTLRPQPSRTPGACAYVVQDENGLWNSYGSVHVDYGPTRSARGSPGETGRLKATRGRCRIWDGPPASPRRPETCRVRMCAPRAWMCSTPTCYSGAASAQTPTYRRVPATTWKRSATP
jgi:hypothetical protein